MKYETDLMATQRFPGLSRAALEMAYANGGINRDRREDEVLKKLHELVGSFVVIDMMPIDLWLSRLSEDDMLTAVDGEEEDQKKVLAGAPPMTDLILNAIFEHVI